MNNMQIIANEAVASGYFTEEEIEELIENGEDIPFHTYAIWKSRYGMVPKRNSKGWECRLWRKKDKKKVDEKETEEVSEEDRKNNFYLTKSFLFHISQLQKLEEKKVVSQ